MDNKVIQNLEKGSFEDLRILAQEVIKSGLSPLPSESAVMIAIISGRELGIPPMAAINNIYDVGGKATPSIHLMNALAINNDVSFEVLKDFEIERTYTDGEGNLYDEEEVKLNEKEGVWQVVTKAQLSNEASKAKIVAKAIKIIVVSSERVTKVLLTRQIKDKPNRTFISTYKLSTAIRAKLIKPGGAWDIDPANQCLVRALSKGFRYIGDDFMLAMPYETTEMMDAKEIEYAVNDESIVSKITILDKEPTINENQSNINKAKKNEN